MKRCENRGNIKGEIRGTGGNTGFNSGTIEGCNNSGAVTGKYYVGGNIGKSSVEINEQTLINTGTVNGESAATAKKIGNR